MLVVREIILQSHFELLEMYMLDTFLQFGLLMRTRVIPSGLLVPNSNPSHPNCIQMQYWTPASNKYVNAETYKGWDSTSGNI